MNECPLRETDTGNQGYCAVYGLCSGKFAEICGAHKRILAFRDAAVAAERERIHEWGNDYCPDHWTGRFMPNVERKDCPYCWQELGGSHESV